MDNDSSVNGTTATLEPELERPAIPEVIHLASTDTGRVPSPGTQRALQAETGRSYDELVGPDAESADRFQTIIWSQLRKTIPGLRWEDCADIEVQIDTDAEAPRADPLAPAASETSPPSVASGA
jgi:hypothetical protein